LSWRNSVSQANGEQCTGKLQENRLHTYSPGKHVFYRQDYNYPARAESTILFELNLKLHLEPNLEPNGALSIFQNKIHPDRKVGADSFRSGVD
jgi:hypothetical protein